MNNVSSVKLVKFLCRLVMVTPPPLPHAQGEVVTRLVLERSSLQVSFKFNTKNRF